LIYFYFIIIHLKLISILLHKNVITYLSNTTTCEIEQASILLKIVSK
jgi:hypothetical protein